MKPRQESDKWSTNQLLDEQATELSARHYRRLEKMTHRAIQTHRDKRKHRVAWLAAPTAAVCIGLLAVWIGWPLHGTRTEITIAAPSSLDSTIPKWVMDPNVPDSLLENMAFYDWLAKQTDEPKQI